MFKNRFDYKLLNFLFFILIIYLIYQTHDFWVELLNIIFKISFPFIIAFIISYALYPILKFLMKKNIPKSLAILIIILIIIFLFSFSLFLIVPTIFNQIGDILGSIITFFKNISLNYNINFYEETVNKTINNILIKISENISNGMLNVVSISIDYITKLFIIITSSIYFLADMGKIRLEIEIFLRRKSKKLYQYLIILDREMTKYLAGFLKLLIISFFEYLIIYYFIGHPNYLMLGTLAGMSNIIPYFGGIITNLIAVITALAVSNELFIRTLIVLLIFSIIDSYIINPWVFGKSNKLHPLAVIMAIFIGGVLFKTMGIIFSLPVSIILISSYKFFKQDISKISKKARKNKVKIVK